MALELHVSDCLLGTFLEWFSSKVSLVSTVIARSHGPQPSSCPLVCLLQICVWVCVCVCVSMSECVWVSVSISVWVWVWVNVCVCVCKKMWVCESVCVCIKCVSVSECVCAHKCTHMYIHTYTHVHTYVRTCTYVCAWCVKRDRDTYVLTRRWKERRGNGKKGSEKEEETLYLQHPSDLTRKLVFLTS